MKGMIYTSFALIVSALLLSLAAIPVSNSFEANSGDATRIGEASFFLESVLKDTERSLSIATRRATVGATNYIVETGKELAKPGKNLTSAVVNGTISGRELNSTGNASLSEWKSRVKSIARENGYSLRLRLKNYSFNSSGFRVEAAYRVFTRLKDPVTLASFNRTRNTSTTVSITGVEDPLLLLRSKGRYLVKFKRCGFNDPAEKLEEGPIYSSGGVHGEAEKNPVDLSSVENASEKILVVDDVKNYNSGDANKFRAIVSAAPNSSSYTTEYVFDTGSIDEIAENQSLVVYRGEIWRTGFRQMFQQKCYVEDAGAPDLLDRFSNDLSGSGGVSTLVDVTALPAELQHQGSVVGYRYFSGSPGKKIHGVSEEFPWFRLDQEHINEWELNSLAY